MTTIEQVYQAIVELQAEQGTDNDITYTTLQAHTGLSIDELRESVSALHEQGKVG